MKTDYEEIEQVSAGQQKKETKTLMHCDVCKWEITWLGDYMNGIYYECPQCNAIAYHGIKYV